MIAKYHDPPLHLQVEALHSKISSLESALASSTAATSQLQDQLSDSRGQQEGELRHLREEKDNFIAQVRARSQAHDFFSYMIAITGPGNGIWELKSLVLAKRWRGSKEVIMSMGEYTCNS